MPKPVPQPSQKASGLVTVAVLNPPPKESQKMSNRNLKVEDKGKSLLPLRKSSTYRQPQPGNSRKFLRSETINVPK